LAQSARQYPLWVFCGADANVERLTAAGAEVIPTQLVGGEIWLPAVMEALVARGITRLLVEGGPATWAAFSRAGLIDAAVLFHARPAGSAEMPADEVMAVASRYISTEGFDLYDRRTIGSDDMLAIRRHWHRGMRRGQTEAT
jgi:diaminohydroxyphosphoribosylaminopyrimidine deaminase/5-amino-6-(5-phosphoribosylamino)uracil reductase